MQLEGMAALVTGAGSDGIGAAVVRALAGAGADVAIHHLDQHERAEALSAEVRATGRGSAVLAADLGVPGEARALFGAAEAALGRPVGAVVLCAGTLKRVPFLELDDAEWDRVMGVNLRGTFEVAQEAARAMVPRGGGRIVMVSSINQDHASPNLAHYVASKGGVRMLARAMALELAPHDVTVNLIAPGTVETDINRAALADPGFREAKTALIPMRWIASPDDIAAAAVYLVGPGAGYVTGATITIDGGLTL